MQQSFNPLPFKEELVKAGLSEAPAKVIANNLYEIIDSNLATKKDLLVVKLQIFIVIGGLVLSGFGVVISYLLDIIKLLPSVNLPGS